MNDLVQQGRSRSRSARVVRQSLLPAVLLVLALLACKSNKPVESRVNCRYAGQFICDVKTTGDVNKRYNVCWDIDVSCADGQKLAANTCMDVSGGSQASSAVPNNRFTGGLCRAGNVTSVAVNNVKITRQN